MSRTTLAAILLSLTALATGLFLGYTHSAAPGTWRGPRCPEIAWVNWEAKIRCDRMTATLIWLKREDLREEWAFWLRG